MQETALQTSAGPITKHQFLERPSGGSRECRRFPAAISTPTSSLSWSIDFQVESPGRKSEKMPAQFDELATGKYVARLQSENVEEPSTHAFSNQVDKSGPPNGSAGLPRASTAP